MSVRQHRPSRSDALRAAIASVRPTESPFGSDPSRRRAVRYVEDQSWRRRTGPQTSASAPVYQSAPAPEHQPTPAPEHQPWSPVSYQHFDATPAGYGSFDSAPVGYGQFEAASWDATEPLYLPSIQLRPRWNDYAPRGLRYGRGRRALGVASVLAALILTAVGVGSVQWPSLPGRSDTTQVAADTPAAPPAEPLPDWSAARRAEAADAADDVTIALGRSPFRGAPGLVEDFPKIVSAPVETASADDKDDAEQPAAPLLRHASPLGQPLTKLVAFASAPFPYDGTKPSGGPFLDYTADGRRGHRTRRGILWEDKTFSDNRSILHIPAGFDPDRPAALVVFFHGYGATLQRDIGARQQVPQQISAAGTNTVLAAPQFAVDARDSSIGKFWQPGGFRRYLAEAAKDFARMQGDPASEQTFANMPIIIVAYSGGFLPAAFALRDIEPTHRVRGVVMLDAAYGEFETFANWAAKDHSHFFVSAYTHFTAPMNGEIERLMAARGLDHSTHMPATLSNGGAVFLAAETPHMDYVTKSWTADPIKDVLQRLPELRLRDPQAIASVDSRYRRDEASVQ